MSDTALIDVTSTDTPSALSDVEGTKCSYCGCLKDGVLMFYCNKCCHWVHANCLQSGPPSLILADNYYYFKCCSCSLDQKETFQRMKLTWVQVVTLALYNLAQTNLGKQGFFKWKEDICVFIERYWDSLFGNEKKRSQQWSCTVASILSAGNPDRFQSGYGQFGETGWWRLNDPTKAPEYQPRVGTATIQRVRSSRKSHFGMSSRSHFRKRQQSSALQISNAKAKQACLKDAETSKYKRTTIKKVVPKVGKNNEVKLNNGSGAQRNGSSNSPMTSRSSEFPDSPASSLSNEGRASKEARVDPLLPLVAISDDEYEQSIDQMSEGRSEWNGFEDKEPCNDDDWLSKYDVEQLKSSNSEVNQVGNEQSSATKPLSLYDEQKLLKKLLHLDSTDGDLQARRLRRKLLLRQKKRQMGLPVFNFDVTVRRLHAKEMGLQVDPADLLDVALPASRSFDDRILDRFLAPDSRRGIVEEGSRTFLQKLIGGDDASAQQVNVSPYTQRVLKPFIRRDFETRPPKLKVLEEIVSHYRRSHPTDCERETTSSSSIDYCYVRARHIPSINALCRHFFWPGVDLSESLQYPDFSVVALYRKMVIGFGFLVPDVAFNEAYISFLFVHPDWQRARLGSFMLYHLMQTCMGKDVTLHVSASNTAMLLYQRFGFKPEKFEADFYDKYLPADAQDCKHAFFMRLQR